MPLFKNAIMILDTKKDSPALLKQRDVFNKLTDERYHRILELRKKISYDDLWYRFNGNILTKKN